MAPPPIKPTLSSRRPDAPADPYDDAAGLELEDEPEDDEEYEDEDEDEDSATPAILQDALGVAYAAFLSDQGALPAPPAGAPPAMFAIWEALQLVRTLGGTDPGGPQEPTALVELRFASTIAAELNEIAGLTPEQKALVGRIRDLVTPHVPEVEGSDEDLTWHDIFDVDTALELAELLPDAAGPGGAERTAELLAAFVAERYPDLEASTQQFLSETLAAFDIGELRGPTNRFAIRAIVLFSEAAAEPHHVNLVGVSDDDVFPLTETEVFDIDPKLADESDMMRLAAALLDGLSDYTEDGQTLSLSPPFNGLAKPYGSMRVGQGLSPADRRQARAERVRAMKRRR